jgi:signal recognition particle subunit SRP54
MRQVTGKPIKFIGEGEKLDQLAAFHPDRMASRILGMGDVVSMVENVADNINEEEAMHAAKRLQSGKFDFNDFLDQMNMLRKLGPLDGLMGMLPGFNKIKKQIPSDAFDEKKMKRMEAIVLSMTPRERGRPELIKGKRRRRIAEGSGNSVIEVNRFIKQFNQMRKMMRSKGKMKQMMQQMGGMEGLEGMDDMKDLGDMKGLKGLLGKGGKMPKLPF